MANYTKEQQSAIYTKDKNILVSASAGSGKTAVLVERVINKVINEKQDIDKLLVVTFTNASAAELKERLLKALYLELDKTPKDMFLKRQIQLLNRANITTIHSFCMGIIRSNFHLLGIDPNFKICDETRAFALKQKAMERVLEKKYLEGITEEKVESAYSKKLYKILELFGGKEEEFCNAVTSIYSYIQSFAYPFSWLYENINKYLIKEDDIDIYNTSFGKYIYDNTLEQIEIVKKECEEFLEILREDEEFIKFVSVLETDVGNLKQCLHIMPRSWDKLFETLNGIKFANAPRYSGDNIELKEKFAKFRKDILKQTVKEACKNVYTTSENILKDNAHAYSYLEYIYEFLKEFDIEYSKEKRNINVVDFNDIEHMALDLLICVSEDGSSKLTEVASRLKEDFYEIYTDEYQDTSFVQEEILNAIASDSNRFMVGDIKQSIYRFRQAMPDIFNAKYDKFRLLDSENESEFEANSENDNSDCKIILAKNFRSRKHILDSINYIFENIMSKKSGDCEYSDSEVLKFGAAYYKESDQNYKTQINILDVKVEKNESDIENTEILEDTKDSGFENDNTLEHIDDLKDFELESILVAKKIKEIVGVYSIYDTKKEEFRKAKYSDIVVLLRNIKDKGNILEDTFRKFGIDAFSDVSSSIFEGSEVKLVTSFLRIIDNPLQDIHFVSTMYSILGKFSLSEIYMIKTVMKKKSMYDCCMFLDEIYKSGNDIELEISKYDLEGVNKDIIKLIKIETSEKITVFISLINKFRMYSKMYTVSQLLSRLYNNTGIYYQCVLGDMHKNKWANLDLLVQMASKLEDYTSTSLSKYISYIDSLKNKVDESTSVAKMIGENEDVVRIMTIHKSKGLEFPIVMLCDTSRKYNVSDMTNKITLHHELGVGINIVNEDYNVVYPSIVKTAIASRLDCENKNEELRMLYVALTRAKEKLFVFATTKDYSKLLDNGFMLYEDNKVHHKIVMKNNSYIQNILLGINADIYRGDKYPKKEDVFDINVYTKDSDYFNECSKYLSENIESSKNKEKLSKKVTELSSKYECCEDRLNELTQYVRENLEYTYAYQKQANTPYKVSVSELKEKQKNKENTGMFCLSEFEKPDCIEKSGKNTSIRKGILIHFILENLDFCKSFNYESLSQYILDLVQKGVLTKEDSEDINVEDILALLNSSMVQGIRSAKSVHKEEQFILNDPEFSDSLIQGIIDLYYITTDDRIVVIDFKTDKTLDESTYISNYKLQLDIYASAVSKLLNKKVKNKYIYSFALKRAIEVK